MPVEAEMETYEDCLNLNSGVGWAPVMWKTKELEEIVKKLCAEDNVDFEKIKEGRRVVKLKNGMWQEEMVAIIAGSLWRSLPIADRVDFISKFINRTHRQVKSLLKIYYRWGVVDAYNEPYGMGDIVFDYYWEIESFFAKMYRIDPHYQYRDRPYKK